jgi:hypothetical protein
MCRVLEDEGATSFDFAETQQEAVAAAGAHPPALITSDVGLREGTGPLAVAAIQARLGPVPVMFITATPEDCAPCARRLWSSPSRSRAPPSPAPSTTSRRRPPRCRPIAEIDRPRERPAFADGCLFR